MTLLRRIIAAIRLRKTDSPATINRQVRPMFPEKSFDVLIARAAERKCNRDRAAADQFIRKHMILKEGRN